MFDLDELVAECAVAVRDPRPARRGTRRDDQDARAARRPRDRTGQETMPAWIVMYVSPELTILNVVWAPRMMIFPHDHRMPRRSVSTGERRPTRSTGEGGIGSRGPGSARSRPATSSASVPMRSTRWPIRSAVSHGGDPRVRRGLRQPAAQPVGPRHDARGALRVDRAAPPVRRSERGVAGAARPGSRLGVHLTGVAPVLLFLCVFLTTLVTDAFLWSGL